MDVNEGVAIHIILDRIRLGNEWKIWKTKQEGARVEERSGLAKCPKSWKDGHLFKYVSLNEMSWLPA